MLYYQSCRAVAGAAPGAKKETEKGRKKDLTKQDRSARISKLSEGAREGVRCEAEKSSQKST